MPRFRPGPFFALTLSAGAFGAAAQPAAAAVGFRATVSPAMVSSPAKLDYGLQMVNDGLTEERFSVALISPTYHPARLGDALDESASVRRIGAPVIDGPATMPGTPVNVAGLLPACSAAGAGGHGYGIDGMTFNVALPAGSTSTVHVTYVAGLPFWPDLDLRLRFLIGTRLTDGKRGTLAGERKVLSPQPAITGPVAVHMTLATTPASGLSSFAARPAVALGTAIAVRGRTNPAIPGQRIELRYARIGSRSNVLARGRAARPRVGDDGTFRARWTPPRPGDYELWARYTSQGPGLVSDDTCPRLLRIRRR